MRGSQLLRRAVAALMRRRVAAAAAAAAVAAVLAARLVAAELHGAAAWQLSAGAWQGDAVQQTVAAASVAAWLTAAVAVAAAAAAAWHEKRVVQAVAAFPQYVLKRAGWNRACCDICM